MLRRSPQAHARSALIGGVAADAHGIGEFDLARAHGIKRHHHGQDFGQGGWRDTLIGILSEKDFSGFRIQKHGGADVERPAWGLPRDVFSRARRAGIRDRGEDQSESDAQEPGKNRNPCAHAAYAGDCCHARLVGNEWRKQIESLFQPDTLDKGNKGDFPLTRVSGTRQKT